VDLTVLPPFSRRVVKFIVPRGDESVDAAAKAANMPVRDFRNVADDVADVLSAAVSTASVERFISVRTSEDEDGEAENADLAQRKFELVSARFEIGDLKRRAWIKRRAKTDVLYDVEWDVSRKSHDSGSDAPEETPVTVGLIRLSSGPPDNPLAIAFGQGVTNPTLTVDEGDVIALINSLQRLHAAMRLEEGSRE
jgi:hypothetical protein